MAHLEYAKRCAIKLLYLISVEKLYKGKVKLIFYERYKNTNEYRHTKREEKEKTTKFG